MRLFFLGWCGAGLGLNAVIKQISETHEVVYWTGSPEEFHPAEFPGVIFHDQVDALEGKTPRAVDAAEFLPPSKDILHTLLDIESLVLTMMNKHFENESVSQRKRRYYELVRYWRGVLTTLKPDAVIFVVPPHTVYDFVVYGLAKLLKVKTVMLEPTWVGDRLAIMEDYHYGSRHLAEAAAHFRSKEVTLEQLSPDVQAYYRWHTADQEADLTPIFVRNLRSRYSGLSLLRLKAQVILESVKDFSIVKKFFLFCFKFFGSNIKKEHVRAQSEPEWNKDFVYFALHQQPERSSSPQGDVFVDQILTVQTLAAALPSGWLLYVKEHPTQWLVRGVNYFSYRPPGYYEEIAKIKNVRLVPLQTSNYILISRARAVATLMGTSGFEALVRQKAVLVFGYPWYRDCPGVLQVADVDSCRRALESIQDGFAPTRQDILNYFGAFDRATFHGHVDFDGPRVSQLSKEENTANILKALVRELTQ